MYDGGGVSTDQHSGYDDKNRAGDDDANPYAGFSEGKQWDQQQTVVAIAFQPFKNKCVDFGILRGPTENRESITLS